MSQIVTTGIKSYRAGAAIGQFLRVKLTSGLLALAGLGASDEPLEIGVLEEPSFATGDLRPVRLRSSQGTTKMVAAGAIAAGVAVYGAANGQISTTASGNPIGVSQEAATAAGDIIEVVRY